MNKKINLAILFGGRSGEHDFNLPACGRIIFNLSPEKYNIKPVKILKNGQWFTRDGFFENVGSQTTTEEVDKWISEKECPGDIVNALEKMRKDNIEVVWPAVYGEYGEDGCLQGLLELMDIAYVGAGVTSSAINLDKEYFYQIMIANGLNVGQFAIIDNMEWQLDFNSEVERVLNKIPLPVVIKAADRGLSIGTYYTETKEEFIKYVNDCLEITKKIIIQEFLNGYEINCAILDIEQNQKPVALPPIGVKLHSGKIFDLDLKTSHGFSEDMPPKVDDKTLEEIKRIAIKVYEATGCEGYSRVELMLVKNKIYVQENNTLTGMGSEISLYPKAAKAVGIGYGELIDKLIHHALCKTRNLNYKFLKD
jgi:D-alanine-D-alanine ligase